VAQHRCPSHAGGRQGDSLMPSWHTVALLHDQAAACYRWASAAYRNRARAFGSGWYSCTVHQAGFCGWYSWEHPGRVR
jgi:hypothetical protein